MHLGAGGEPPEFRAWWALPLPFHSCLLQQYKQAASTLRKECVPRSGGLLLFWPPGRQTPGFPGSISQWSLHSLVHRTTANEEAVFKQALEPCPLMATQRPLRIRAEVAGKAASFVSPWTGLTAYSPSCLQRRC